MSGTSKPRGSRAIPSSLHGAVVTRLAEKSPSGKPYTAQEVATWLQTEHGVTASRMSVLRLHAAVDAKGAALLVEALRATLRDSVGPALARVRRGARRVDALLSKERNTQKAAAGLSALTRALHEIATLGGVAAPIAVDHTTNGQPLPDVYAALAAGLARLAAEPDADCAGDAPDKPPA